MPAIDAKVGIGGQHNGIAMRLSHADEARIRQAHGHVRVFLHEGKCCLTFPLEIEGDLDVVTLQEGDKWPRVAQAKQIERLRQHRLAREPREWTPLRFRDGPSVMSIIPVEQTNKKA